MLKCGRETCILELRDSSDCSFLWCPSADWEPWTVKNTNVLPVGLLKLPSVRKKTNRHRETCLYNTECVIDSVTWEQVGSSQTAVKAAAILSQEKHQWSPAFAGKSTDQGNSRIHETVTHGQCLFHKKHTKEEIREGRRRKRKGRNVITVSSYTNLCSIYQGTQSSRNQASESAWSNCRRRKKQKQKTENPQPLLQSPWFRADSLLLWVKQNHVVCCQRRFTQQGTTLNATLQWDK